MKKQQTRFAFRAIPTLIAAVMGLCLACTATAAEPPCTGSDFHQFDFWIGHWQVSTPDNVVIGHNHISSIAGGCAILEEWAGAAGDSGKSLITYEPERHRWHQLWVSSQGEHTNFYGRSALGGMVLETREPENNGRNLRRVLLRAVSKNELKQAQHTSKDGGKSWVTEYEFTYRRLTNQK